MKKRILLTGSDNFGKGGRSVIGWNLTEPITDTYKIDFLANHEISMNIIDSMAKRQGEIKICHLSGSNKITRKFNFIKKVMNTIKKEGYDIIHINADDPKEAITPILASQLAGINKFVIHAHNSSDSDKWHKKILNWFLRKYMRLTIHNVEEIACSKQAGQYFFNQSEGFTIIKNGIDLSKYKIDENIRESVFEEFGIDASRLIVGTVGRIANQKNPLFIIEILRELKKINPSFLFVWVGEGDMEAIVKQKADDYGISENMLFLGSRRDVHRILTIFDVFILPSKYEGFGIVNVEAQVLGIPCLVSQAIPDIAKINDNFYFLGLNDTMDLWAKRIVEISSEPRQNVDLQRFLDRGFDIKQGAFKLDKIYQKLLKN